MADFGKIIETGSCGAEVSYTVYENEEKLTAVLTGKGATFDCADVKQSPFIKYRDSLYSVIVEKGITGLGDRTFKGFENLHEVKLPAGLKYVGAECFASCLMLSELRFLKGFEILSPKAAEKCVSLKKLYFPASLRAVDFKATHGCTALEKVIYRGSEAQWQRCIRVSPSALGNAYLTSAEFSFAAESSRFAKLGAALGKIIRKGGDGRLHIAAPNLTVPGAKGKSGDCTFMVFPDGETMMIDAGAPFASEHMLNFVKAMKLDKLDYFVLSHAHGDHWGGALKTAKYICETAGGFVGHYLYSGYVSQKPNVAELEAYLVSHGTEMNTHVREGDVFDIAGVHIDVFNPDDEVLAQESKGDDAVNNMSVSLKFTYGASSFLATGDLYSGREKYLAAKYGAALHADIMKSNHHGLFTSNTAEWFEAVRPRYVLTEDDCCDWTRFEERLRRDKIRHYRVSDRGLTLFTADAEGRYRVKTEY